MLAAFRRYLLWLHHHFDHHRDWSWLECVTQAWWNLWNPVVDGGARNAGLKTWADLVRWYA